MVEMGKYCVNCHKEFDDMEYTVCPYCKGELIKINKDESPLGQSRDAIFVRDGHRCRECGKSDKEDNLEIYHICPLSKGGQTTEENLLTLCAACNQAKKDYMLIDVEIETTRNELYNLENQLYETEKYLKVAETEEEEFALKAKIKDLKKNKIPNNEDKLKRLIQEYERIHAERKSQLNENKRRKNLYNKLYVLLDGKLLLEVCNHFSLTESSDEHNIRLLIDRYDENKIFSSIKSIEKQMAEENIRKEFFDKLCNTLSDYEISLFSKHFSLNNYKSDVINYLIDNYSEDEIDSLKIKLVKEDEKRIKQENRKKLFDKLCKTLSDDEIELFKKEFSLEKSKPEIINYLMDKYTEDKIEDKRSELVKKEEERIEEERKRKLFDKLINRLSDKEIELFKKEFSLEKSKPEIINYLVDNYTEDKIDSLRDELVKKEQDAIEEKERQLEHLKDILDFKIMNKACKKFNLTEKYYVNDFINELKPLHYEEVNTIYKYIMEFY